MLCINASCYVLSHHAHLQIICTEIEYMCGINNPLSHIIFHTTLEEKQKYDMIYFDSHEMVADTFDQGYQENVAKIPFNMSIKRVINSMQSI